MRVSPLVGKRCPSSQDAPRKFPPARHLHVDVGEEGGGDLGDSDNLILKKVLFCFLFFCRAGFFSLRNVFFV